MERYVLDCSVSTKWFVPEPLSDRAIPVLSKLQAGSISLIAPESLSAEFGHALRRLVIGQRLTRDQALSAMDRFLALPIEAGETRTLARRALELALGHMATFYDALYIALAEREDVKVLTADDGMVNAFAGLGRTVRLADLAND